MATDTAYAPVTVTELDRDRWDDHDALAEGQGVQMAAIGFTNEQFDRLLVPRLVEGDHPAILAWERLVDEVVLDVSPQIRDVIYNALQKRLPWTWEPER